MKKLGRALYLFNKSRYGRLIAEKEKGEAMIAVLCIMAVILALCLSLLLGSYQMFASVNDSTQDEKYYQQALSFSEALQKKILARKAYESANSSADNFILGFMKDNDNYKVQQGVPVTLTFTASPDDTNGNYGDIKLTLTKEDIGLSTADVEGTNGWSESIEYYLVVNVQVLDKSAKPRADVSTKYDFTYSIGSYNYYSKDESGNTTPYYPVTGSSELISIDNEQVKISTLKKNFGNYTKSDGTKITVIRDAKQTSDQTYTFISLGRI